MLLGSGARVVIDGVARTWHRLAQEKAECYCGSTVFKHSRLRPDHWYCKACNEQYEDEKPYFPQTLCSKHGVTHDGIGDDRRCPECEEEADLAGETITVEEESITWLLTATAAAKNVQ
jgi:rubredoxin